MKKTKNDYKEIVQYLKKKGFVEIKDKERIKELKREERSYRSVHKKKSR